MYVFFYLALDTEWDLLAVLFCLAYVIREDVIHFLLNSDISHRESGVLHALEKSLTSSGLQQGGHGRSGLVVQTLYLAGSLAAFSCVLSRDFRLAHHSVSGTGKQIVHRINNGAPHWIEGLQPVEFWASCPCSLLDQLVAFQVLGLHFAPWSSIPSVHGRNRNSRCIRALYKVTGCGAL